MKQLLIPSSCAWVILILSDISGAGRSKVPIEIAL